MTNTVLVHNHMPFQSRCRPAYLTAYNTHCAIRLLRNTSIYGGAHGVIDTVIENSHSDLSLYPEQGFLHFT